MESLTLEQIILAVGGDLGGQNQVESVAVTSLSIDSRDIKQNALYIPIKGERFDGHLFIEDAFDKGATIAFTQDRQITSSKGVLVYVEDTKKALMNLAAYYRNQFDIPVVAITGSVGKTSTKDLVASVLSANYKVHKTQGNFNNEIGLPLTIFGLSKDHEVLVVEMGMNHFGEIHKLSKIARPDLAIITNVGLSHIENLGDQEGILKAKLEILDGMSEGGKLIINGDDELLQTIKTPGNLITYGRDKNNLFFAENIRSLGMGGMLATFNTPTWAMEIAISALGDHMIDNALAAIAVAQALGLSEADIKKGFKGYTPTGMRMDLQQAKNSVYIINDAYNASPDSMKAALNVLASMPNMKRKIAILGDMFELGDYAIPLHREVGGYIGEQGMVDLLITVGDLSQQIQLGAIGQGLSKGKALHFQSQEDLIAKLGDLIRPEDMVLVKASRGMELEKTVDEIGKVKLNEQ